MLKTCFVDKKLGSNNVTTASPAAKRSRVEVETNNDDESGSDEIVDPPDVS